MHMSFCDLRLQDLLNQLLSHMMTQPNKADRVYLIHTTTIGLNRKLSQTLFKINWVFFLSILR